MHKPDSDGADSDNSRCISVRGMYERRVRRLLHRQDGGGDGEVEGRVWG